MSPYRAKLIIILIISINSNTHPAGFFFGFWFSLGEPNNSLFPVIRWIEIIQQNLCILKMFESRSNVPNKPESVSWMTKVFIIYYFWRFEIPPFFLHVHRRSIEYDGWLQSPGGGSMTQEKACIRIGRDKLVICVACVVHQVQQRWIINSSPADWLNMYLLIILVMRKIVHYVERVVRVVKW